MKFALRGVSGAALLFGLAGAANAQQAPNQTVNTAQPAVQAPAGGPQVAQTGPQAAPESAEKVVITGSLIATTPEDAPKPVEVYGKEELKEQGNPSVSNFIRSLSTTYGSSLGFGQANPQVPTAAGFTDADLRGLGPNATMVLLNGRRAAAANGGFGADLNTIPQEALEAVEILKDGASSTYGAGAVGGVINFRTRRDINGPQLSVEKTFYQGGDGNLKIDFLDGWKGDAGNLLITYGHEHEGAMSATKRSFSNEPFAIDPSSWSLTPGNPGGFNAISTPFLSGAACTGTVGGCTAGLIPSTAVSAGAISPQVEDLPGGATNLVSASAAATTACQAIGGQIANQIQSGAKTISTLQNNVGCAFPLAPEEDLISDTTTNRAYAEFNANLSDTMEVSFNVTYSKNQTFQNVPPSAAANVNRATDGTIGAANFQCATGLSLQYGCYYVIPSQVNTYTTSGLATASAASNPFIADFMTRTGLSAAQLPSTGALYTAADWRPYLFGGNPMFNNGLTQDVFFRERVLVNAGTKGELSDQGVLGRVGLGKLFSGVSYDFNGQFDQYFQTNITPDIFAARLQNALLGYGGPSCNAVDRVPTDFTSAQSFNRTIGIQSDTAPGTQGCQWFNPFASSFPTSIWNGKANPQFNAGAPVLGIGSTARQIGYQNPKDLVDWMTGNKDAEDLYQTGTFDYTLSGELPKGLQLPGGKIGWAGGGQWRVLERRSQSYDANASERQLNFQKCPFPDPAVVEQSGATAATATNTPNQSAQQPGSRGCPTGSGAFIGSGVVNITGNNPPIYTDSQVFAYYGEITLPVLDNLNFDASARHEEYNGGDLKATIYNVSGKYSITDNLYFRASYGTNFRADSALDLHPGQTTQSNPSTTRFGGIILPTFTTVDQGIGAEDDKTQNFGFGYKNNDIFGGRIRSSIDWWQVQINGAVTTTSAANILSNVFGRNDTSGIGASPNLGVGGSQNARSTGNPLLPNTGAINNLNQFADCSASQIAFVTFSTPCVTGVTTATQLTSIQLLQLNGPSFVTNGIDYSFDYSHPLFNGNVGVNATATEALVYKADAFIAHGTLFAAASNNLGYANWTHNGAGGTNGGPGIPSARWKANATLRWSNDEHNFNVRANFQSGIKDERFDPGAVQALPLTPLQAGTTNWSTYGIFPKDYLSFDLVYIYTPQWMKGLEFQAQVLDLTDRDPLHGQFQLGYGSGIGDPRKRQFVFRITDKF